METLNISNWIINGSPYTEWETGIFVIRGYIDSMTKLIADGWDIQMDLENGFSLWGGEFVTPINYFSQRPGTLEISVNDWNLNDHKVDLSTISSITTKEPRVLPDGPVSVVLPTWMECLNIWMMLKQSLLQMKILRM